MKIVKRILVFAAIIIVSLVLLIYLLLWLPPVQQKITDGALGILSEKTGSSMSVGKIHLRPFSSLMLNDIYVADLHGDTLVYMEQLSAEFNLWPLLRNRLTIHSVDLNGFVIHLTKDSVDAPFNFQFLVDAFASTDAPPDTTSSDFAIEVGNVRLSRGCFSSDILSEPVLDSVFDANHIHISGLEAHLCLPSIDITNLDISVKHFAFRERSGFVLDRLGLQVVSSGDVLNLIDFRLQMPYSMVEIPKATVDYTEPGFDRMMDAAKYELLLDVPYFRLSDVKAFMPVLTDFPDSIILQTVISGQLPSVNVNSFDLSYGQGVRLQMKAMLGDYVHWDTSRIELHIPQLTIQPQTLSQVTAMTGNTLPVYTEGLKLTTALSGILPEMNLRISATSEPSGTLDISGTGGYLVRTGESRFNLHLLADRLDLKTLLNGNPELGFAGFALNAAGDIDSTGKINAKAGLDLGYFDFHQYTYQDVGISAEYINDKLRFNLLSKDTHAPLQINARADISGKEPTASLYLKAGHVMLEKLNLTPEYKEADFFAVLKAGVTGFDPDKMIADITFDSLFFSTIKGSTSLERIDLRYESMPDFRKKMNLASKLITADLTGHFSINSIATSIQNTLAVYFPNFLQPQPAQRKTAPDSLSLAITIQDTDRWADLLAAPVSIAEPSTVHIAYNSMADFLKFDAIFPKTRMDSMILKDSYFNLVTDPSDRRIKLGAGAVSHTDSDTMSVQLTAGTYTDSVRMGLLFKMNAPGIDAGGGLDLAARFEKVKGRELPDIFVQTFPSMMMFNQQALNMKPAIFSIRGEEYEVDNFEMAFSDSEYLKINGRVSRNDADTLKVGLGGIQIGTIMRAVSPEIDVAGEINGEILANRLLESPHILSEGISVKGISLKDHFIGDLNLKSVWDNSQEGLLIGAELSRENARTSVVSGSIFPKKDSLAIVADINEIRMEWLEPFTTGMLYNLGGSLGMHVQAQGSMKAPALSGSVIMKDINAGVSMLNVQYGISDTIQLFPDRLVWKDFRITDERQQQTVINGELRHTNFSDFLPNLSMRMEDFTLLNNPGQTDSLLYGTLRVSGSIDAENTDQDGMLVKVAIKNSVGSKVFVTLPEEQASEANQYKSVTFVNKDSLYLSSDTSKHKPAPEDAMPKLPIRLQLALELTPDMQIGAVYNAKTKDAATISGLGKINLDYNMANSNMNLLGTYNLSGGGCTVSLKNITKKTFHILPGGTVTFTGDPLATEFDVTAMYKLRADLMSLDPIFQTLPRTRVNTECHIHVSGNLDKMSISYSILFPDEDESVQRKADALMSTEEIKLKEVAYLLVAGRFYPPVNTETSAPSGSTVWTTLASSALTTQLNNMLDGVLSDNWTVGADIHSDDGNASNLEMDLNISTSLFNNRLQVSTNIGYRNTDANSSNSSLTGDFDVQYKLKPGGDVVLKMYNVTNENLYEQAQSPTTQGVGVMYRRETKRFSDLFRRKKKVKE